MERTFTNKIEKHLPKSDPNRQLNPTEQSRVDRILQQNSTQREIMPQDLDLLEVHLNALRRATGTYRRNAEVSGSGKTPGEINNKFVDIASTKTILRAWGRRVEDSENDDLELESMAAAA